MKRTFKQVLLSVTVLALVAAMLTSVIAQASVPFSSGSIDAENKDIDPESMTTESEEQTPITGSYVSSTNGRRRFISMRRDCSEPATNLLLLAPRGLRLKPLI